MHLSSSPLQYPTTSSPVLDVPRKKRKVHEDKEPLKKVTANENFARRHGFLLDESDDDLDDVAFLKTSHAARLQLDHHEVDAQDVIETTPSFGGSEIEEEQHGAPEAPNATVPDLMEKTPALWMISTSTVDKRYCIRTCSGKTLSARARPKELNQAYKDIVASRSVEVAGRAQKSYFGIDIHRLFDEGKKENDLRAATREASSDDPRQYTEQHSIAATSTPPSKLLWTEKYRARKFTDLVGDERTHRSVLRWLKAWDPIVFPHANRAKISRRKTLEEQEPERTHRKVLLLTGPPGLGKTTLAHVCAKQAGYEVHEINASDERSKDVVKGRIRDMVCTENVRPMDVGTNGKIKRSAKPMCVVVDEVDGVVSGSGGGGEGGFIKALVDLLALDQKNSSNMQRQSTTTEPARQKKKKGDRFRMLRPLILICNDLYHPSLRALRQGNIAEIVYVRKPPLNMIIPRLQSIFSDEGIPCDTDGVRQLCEATWGVSTRKENRSTTGTADGDMRGILVIGEWVASKLRAETAAKDTALRLTKQWVASFVSGDLAQGGGAARGLGRGGSKEVVERVFAHNAGFPVISGTAHTAKGAARTASVAEAAKERAMQRLAEMVASSGEDDRIMTDCFSAYPDQPFQDDIYLTKPTLASSWLQFHDTVSTAVHTSQEWELGPYLSTPVLAFHHLFASTSPYSDHAHGGTSHKIHANTDDFTDNSKLEHPYTGPRAYHTHIEALRASLAQLTHLQTQLSLPLLRSFRSSADIATDLLPYVLCILNPDIKPVVVGGSGDKGVASVRRGPEKEKVGRGVSAMIACGVRFEKGKVEFGDDDGGPVGHGASTGGGGWVYRMEPPVDSLGVFETMANAGSVNAGGAGEKVRYAVKQVLDQEHKREIIRGEQEARMRRSQAGGHGLSARTATGSGNGQSVQQNVDVSGTGTKTSTTANIAIPNQSRVKRDFFGRAIVGANSCESVDGLRSGNGAAGGSGLEQESQRGRTGKKVWVTFHEGFSNAVRKPLTLRELLDGL